MWHPLAKAASAAARSVGPSAEQVLVEPRQVLVESSQVLGAPCGAFTAAGAAGQETTTPAGAVKAYQRAAH